MANFQGILIVLAVLYCVELHVTLPPSALVLRAHFGSRFHVVIPEQAALRWGHGFVVPGAWFPWSTFFTAEATPFRLDGGRVRPGPGFTVCPGIPPSQTPAIELSPARLPRSVQSQILFGEGHVWRTASDEAARAFVQVLARLALFEPGQRPDVLRQWQLQRSDEQAITEELARFRRVCGPLSLACTAFFLFVFGAVAAASWPLPFTLPWQALGVSYWALLLLVQILFFRAHRDRYPTARPARWLAVVTMVLSPASAMLAVHGLSRSWFAAHEPRAVARCLLSPRRFASIDERWQRSRRFGSLLLPEEAAEVDRRLDPPTPQDGCICYCPRCLAQYAVARAECADCPGVSTSALA